MQQLHLYRLKLMKSGCRPWMENDRMLLKKRIGYIPYQICAFFMSQKQLISAFERVSRCPAGNMVYQQVAMPQSFEYPADLFLNLQTLYFEGEPFSCPKDYDTFLSTLYGDYMTLPPEDQRENRHQIRILEFPETCKER